MSFQGDVAGIGLGELLQGLSRGGRDGVLTLEGGRQSAALGMKKGLLYLLAGPDEKPEQWRDRCQHAFADRPDPALETQRRERIARASRLQAVYEMLEAANLHFRFEPGYLPGIPRSQDATPVVLDDAEELKAAWGLPMPVEYLLLEQARISDEAKSGAAAKLSGYDIPRALDPSRHTPEVRDFLQQCDGSSTIQEIADRFGWPLLQCRTTVSEYLERGHLRMAEPRELLAAAQHEMELKRNGRAATRLTAWVLSSPPGPPSTSDANLLVDQWEVGNLAHVLSWLAPRHGRALLRKLDSAVDHPEATRSRWRVLFEAHRGDEVAMLHEIALRLVSMEETDTRVFQDLLRLARSFQERGLEGRTRMLLRLAARHVPSRPQTRIELGRRMIETGLVMEGTRWLLDTAHELIERSDPEHAMVPIRAVLHQVPDHNEATSLLIQARALLAKKRRRRVHTATALCVALVAVLAALVKFRSYAKIERSIAEISAQQDDPARALALLDERFGDDPPEQALELRQRLSLLKREKERHLLKEWTVHRDEVAETIQSGDPLLGLQEALALPAPPTDDDLDAPGFTERQQLLGLLAARLQERSEALDLPPNAPIEALREEERLVDLLGELQQVIDPDEVPPEAVAFFFRVTELSDEIAARRERRAADRARLITREKERQQDILLATARAHAEAGDLERALVAFDRLLESDEELASVEPLVREIDAVRDHWQALQRALELAERGDHEAAEAELRTACKRPGEHLLPFRVESHPSGARVTMPDGGVRVTPFVAKAAIGEKTELRFEYPDFLPRVVRFDVPRDLDVHLHRFPERSWTSEHRIEAAPVPAGNDHIIADRRGRILRLGPDGEPVWDITLDTLGGIARTPIFLPEKPGFLLVVSEDGLAWLVDAQDGRVAGPHDVGSPPLSGPKLTRGGAAVQFADGRVGVWSRRLEPTFYATAERTGLSMSAQDDVSSTLVVLRSRVDAKNVLTSPWNDWKVEVRPDDFRVLTPDGKGFTAERHGQWMFVAWEAPKAFVPHGRLWVSDEAGLRSYLPTLEELIPYDTGD